MTMNLLQAFFYKNYNFIDISLYNRGIYFFLAPFLAFWTASASETAGFFL
jgi:hypothetical protein